MTAKQIMTQMHATIHDLLPHLHGHQLKALSALCYGLAAAKHCHLSRCALAVPSQAATPQSTQKRLSRLLANERVDVLRCALSLSRALLSRWQGRRLVLLLDETPLSDALRVLKVSLCYQGRALPLVWCCYAPAALPASQPRLAFGLLARLGRCLPPQTPVVLLADRGLCWPRLIDLCRRRQWDFVLRAQGQTRVCLHSGTTTSTAVALSSLAPRRGTCYYGRGQAFKKAGWRDVNVVAVWPQDVKEPWLLVTSLEPSRHCCRLYRQRMWQEESFRDEKRQGFGWGQSRVRTPTHAARLLLGLCITQIWLLSLGTRARRQRFHAQLAPAHCKTLSLFSLGWRYLHHALWHDLSIHCHLTFFLPKPAPMPNVS